MRIAQYVIATVLGGGLAFITLLSIKALGPRWENDPTPGPFVAALLLTATYWLMVMLLRRYTWLLPGSTRYVMLAAACLAWALVYVSVKAHDDPPIFALLGAVFWLPALFVYRLPFNIRGGPSTPGSNQAL